MVNNQIIVLVVLLAFSALFSGIETALMSLNMIKVNSLLKQKKKGSETLHRIKQNPHRLIITILIGNNLVNIGAASLATIVFTEMFGSSGIGIATGIMTILILIFGEITPKTFASQNAEKISLIVARPIEFLSTILSPIVFLFELISRATTKILGSKKEKQLSEEELETVVTIGVKEGIINKEAAEMVKNVLEFEGTKVANVMTPRIKIESIDGNAQLKDVIDRIVKTPFSRYPVYFKKSDNIIGILDIDDVLKFAKNKKLGIKIKNIIRKISFVPETKEIDELLVELGGKKVPMAIVVDEYSKISGLITIEDILEEIVGDIFDKSKKRESIYIKKINKNLIRIDGRASIEELNRTLHLGLQEERFDTIARFIEKKLKKIPKKGEQIKLKKIIIEVESVTKQGIKTVKILKS